MILGSAALREYRERRTVAVERSPTVFDSVPADAPCDEPDALVHVWDGGRWVPWDTWRVTVGITVEERPPDPGAIPLDAEILAAKCDHARVWLVNEAGCWSMFVGSQKPKNKRPGFASPFRAHAIRVAEQWYGVPVKGWRAEKRETPNDRPTRESSETDQTAILT